MFNDGKFPVIQETYVTLADMNPRTLAALSLLNDLRHSAFEALGRKHKYPALLLLYSFIDICASLSEVPPAKSNSERFKSFLSKYALCHWELFRPYDLWAARSSLLHAFSPLGDHTDKPIGAVPIFYYAWPETEAEVRQTLVSRGYTDFILIDVQTISSLAVSSFNSLWMHIEQDTAFESIFLANAEHLLKDLFQHRLENELVLLDELARMGSENHVG